MFMRYSHFSFNDWKIMYKHSKTVQKISKTISKKEKCDVELLEIGSLLHDIGKTHKGSDGQLHYHHENFNLIQARPLLKILKLDKRRLKKLENIIAYKSRCIEQKIIKDADALALYADKKLYTLYIKWALDEKLYSSIIRKLNKFKKLNFNTSKKIGKKWFEKMKKNWEIRTKKYNH